MTNHHKIADAINDVAKSDIDQLEKYINLGMAITSLIDVHPGVESERAAVRAVMKLQAGDLAAEITTQLAESTLRLACLLSREAEFIKDIGATTIKGARDAITKRNNEGKPKKEPKPKVEATPEVEEALATIGKLEADLAVSNTRAKKAQDDLFEVVAERDKLRTLLTTAGDIEALMAERDDLARRVQQLQELVAGISAPEPEPKVETKTRKIRRPADVDPDNVTHCRRFLREWIGGSTIPLYVLSKKRGEYIVTEDRVTGSKELARATSPWDAVAAACAVIPHHDDADGFTALLPDGLQIVTGKSGAASFLKDGEVVAVYPSARRAFEAVTTLEFA